MPSVLLLVTVQDDLVFSRNVHSDPVIRVRVAPVEIEDEEQSGTLEYDNFVLLVF